MGDEQNEEDEWHAIDEKLRLMYGNNAFQRMTEDEWWRHDYCDRRKKLEEQIKRQKIKVIKPLMFPSIFADRKTVEKQNRKNGQRSRWLMKKFSQQASLKRLGPIECVTDLMAKLSWHPHLDHIWAVATYPGVTSQQLTDCLGVTSSNHRMVFWRFNNDLYHLGWQFVSCQAGAQNEPWGWYLEKI
ncbi:hypothetical protein D3C79_563760 [compost metagenome]